MVKKLPISTAGLVLENLDFLVYSLKHISDLHEHAHHKDFSHEEDSCENNAKGNKE